MSEEETQNFEEQLKKDDTLLEESLISGINIYAEEQDFLKKVKAAEKKMKTQKQAIIKSIPQSQRESTVSSKFISLKYIKPILAIAAAVGLLIVFSNIFFNRELTGSQLVAEHFFYYESKLFSEELEASGFSDGQNAALESVLKEALTLYDQQQYSKSRQKFETYRTQVSKDDFYLPYAEFYLAQILLKEGKQEESIQLLTSLESVEGLPFQSAIAYYLGLNYLAKGDKQKALQYLKPLLSDPKFGNISKKIIQHL